MKWLFLWSALYLAACDTPVNQKIDLSPEAALFHLSGERVSTRPQALERLKTVEMAELPQVDRKLRTLFRTLENSKKHGAWVLEDRVFRDEVFCHELCQCVSNEAVAWVKNGALRLPFGVSIYQLVITSRRGILTAHLGDQARAFHYHQTTLLKDPQNRVSVYDPILFFDSGLHSLKELLSKIDLDDTLQFAVIHRSLH